MNRNQRRASMANGRRLMKLGWNAFEDITRNPDTEAAWRMGVAGGYLKNRPDAVFRNNCYVVQVFRRDRIYFGQVFDRVMIRRNDGGRVTAWHDVQRIKDEIFGACETGIQVFPPAAELTDVANVYWLLVPSVVRQPDRRPTTV